MNNSHAPVGHDRTRRDEGGTGANAPTNKLYNGGKNRKWLKEPPFRKV